jgi:hypothetical protein
VDDLYQGDTRQRLAQRGVGADIERIAELDRGDPAAALLGDDASDVAPAG